MYDRSCGNCGHKLIDCLEPVKPQRVDCPECGAHTRRVWFTSPPAVVGDECDVIIRHGLCDEKTGEPVRYRSKSDIRREAKRRGLVNVDEHIGRPGSDKSPHSVRWV